MTVPAVEKANKIKESGAVRRNSCIFRTGPGRGQQGLIKVRLGWSSINLLCCASDLKLALHDFSSALQWLRVCAWCLAGGDQGWIQTSPPSQTHGLCGGGGSVSAEGRPKATFHPLRLPESRLGVQTWDGHWYPKVTAIQTLSNCWRKITYYKCVKQWLYWNGTSIDNIKPHHDTRRST